MFEWEIFLCDTGTTTQASTMDWNDFIYASLLLFSVLFGHVLKSVEAGRKRQIVSSVVGVALVLIVCGKHGLHSLVTVLVNSVIVLLISPR